MMEFGHAINSLIGLSFVAIPLIFMINMTRTDKEENTEETKKDDKE